MTAGDMDERHVAVASAWWIGNRVLAPQGGPDAASAVYAAPDLAPADKRARTGIATEDLAWAARQRPDLGRRAMSDPDAPSPDTVGLMAVAAHRPGGTGCPFCDPALADVRAALGGGR